MKPRFIPHVCESECNCNKCRDYCNKLDDWRQSQNTSHGGDVKSKKLLTLSRTSNSKIVGEGKRKFELPKPRLTRPFSVIGDNS